MLVWSCRCNFFHEVFYVVKITSSELILNLCFSLHKTFFEKNHNHKTTFFAFLKKIKCKVLGRKPNGQGLGLMLIVVGVTILFNLISLFDFKKMKVLCKKKIINYWANKISYFQHNCVDSSIEISVQMTVSSFRFSVCHGSWQNEWYYHQR